MTNSLRYGHSGGSRNPEWEPFSSRDLKAGYNLKQGYVYIITNKRNGTLYIGVTSDLKRRVWEHKNKVVGGFTAKYGLSRLVYYEAAGDIRAAITREKQMKEWDRSWKLELVEGFNPEWKDLYEEL